MAAATAVPSSAIDMEWMMFMAGESPDMGTPATLVMNTCGDDVSCHHDRSHIHNKDDNDDNDDEDDMSFERSSDAGGSGCRREEGDGDDPTESDEFGIDNDNVMLREPALEATGEPTELYISTKTMIAFLNTPIPIFDLFWKIPIIEYHEPIEGVVKKQIKLTSRTRKEYEEVQTKLAAEPRAVIQEITHVDHYQNGAVNKHMFKDIKKITVGLSSKDITSVRQKKRGVFYNCFVVNMRILWEGRFQEIHIKVFNTGKLEIPGIRSDAILAYSLDKLCAVLSPLMLKDVSYDPANFRTVLINSNFHCGFGIDRERLDLILKHKYKLLSLYDPCSYPGVQCKFYVNPDASLEFSGVSLKKEQTYPVAENSQDGVCRCTKKCGKTGRAAREGTCLEVSFMIFRTGSILIVGRFGEDVLMYVYQWIREVLLTEKAKIMLGYSDNDDTMSVMSGLTSLTGVGSIMTTGIMPSRVKKPSTAIGTIIDMKRRKKIITVTEIM